MYEFLSITWRRGLGLRWADEWSSERVLAAAPAHEKLHRRQLALELYKLSAGNAISDHRIQVLEKVLGV